MLIILSALIGSRDLLPSSAWHASTAVPVEVSYNKSADKEVLYRAEISYATTAEWKQELQLLFEDLQAVALDASGDNDDNDLERTRRIDQSLDKIKYVFHSSTAVQSFSQHQPRSFWDTQMSEMCWTQPRKYSNPPRNSLLLLLNATLTVVTRMARLQVIGLY